MGTIRLLTDVGSVSRASGDRWYVSNGVKPVGPVHFELVVRGIEAGRVPLDSYIRHETWRVWRPLADIACVVADEDGDAPAALLSAPAHFFTPVPTSSPWDDDEITIPGRAAPPRASRPDEVKV